MTVYVVLDTNVLVSAFLTKTEASATFQILEKMYLREFIPVYSREIMAEYEGVLRRKKFGFLPKRVDFLMESIREFGLLIEPSPTGEQLPDMKDLPFYEVVMDDSIDEKYLVTGNIKHFPQKPFIVTPRQLLDLLS